MYEKRIHSYRNRKQILSTNLAGKNKEQVLPRLEFAYKLDYNEFTFLLYAITPLEHNFTILCRISEYFNSFNLE